MSQQPTPTQQPQAQAGTALKPVDALKKSISALDFKAALPAHVSPEKFTRVVLTAISSNQDLVDVERNSLFAACMKAAQDGLLPDGREAALVIFKSQGVPKAQYMPMFAGILKKIRNSGELASITAQIVCKNDKFEFYVDEKGEHLVHKPDMLGDRGDMVGVYAVATTKDGASYIEVMTKKQVEAVRSVSRSKDSGPWASWYDEMARKTVIRRLSKRLPMSTDLEQVLAHDNEDFELEPEAPAPAENPGRPTKLGRIIEQASTATEKGAPTGPGADLASGAPPAPANDDIPV